MSTVEAIHDEEDEMSAPSEEFIELKAWQEEPKYTTADGEEKIPDPAEHGLNVEERYFRKKNMKRLFCLKHQWKLNGTTSSQVRRKYE